MTHLLDNIMWHALVGPHAKFAIGGDEARRFMPGFSPIIGFANTERPNLDALSRYCKQDEHFYCDGWSGSAPAEWRIDVESIMCKMVWHGATPEIDAAPDAVRLGPEHASQAFELAELTHPGPFGLRTIELGEYFGYFEGQRLIAMAGERMRAGTLREISGVCTHPDFQGRGFARRLLTKLLRRELQRNETPFLHVMQANAGARRLYEQMGFRNYRETVVRVISRC
jgi:ribosomal protein S18 acetylase RimI-like enzyme